MSGFSPELIDYLEGKISFEEFERRREERKPFSASQHAHSLQHGEGPVGGQGLSHGPGTVVPDPVALEAVEARRGITGGAQEGAR